MNGKQSTSTGYDLALDYIRLTPAGCSPAVSGLKDQTIALNGTLPARLFLAEDDVAQGTLQVTATSSNSALLPDDAIVLQGASPYYTITAAPTANQLGTTVIGVTASDGTLSTTGTFTLNVTGTPLQTWRQQYFGSTAAAGAAADLFDANGDGESNFYEFATGQNPGAMTWKHAALAKSGANIEFTYTRSNAAVAEGVAFNVEWSDTLMPGSWTSVGAGIVQTDDGILQTVKASVPAAQKRFARLRVSHP